MYISVDVGGTNTRVAGALDIDNPAFESTPLRRRNTHNFENDIEFIITSALRIAGNDRVQAVGIGTPGSPNDDKTKMKSARNLRSWEDKPLVSTLRGALDCEVFYDNDVVAASLAEVYYGQGLGDFDYLIWGTGVGGAEVHRTSSTPEIKILNWQEHFSDWERSVGGKEIASFFGKPPEEFTIADWEVVSTRFHEHLRRFISANQPKAVIFGGGLAVTHAKLIEKAGQYLGVKIGVTKFGEDSGLMGGFGLIKRGTT